MAKRQMEIVGTEGKRVKEIDDAAEHYQDHKKKRMKATEKEVEAKVALIAVMEKHKLENYRDSNAVPPLHVILKPGKAGVKVEELDPEAETGPDEEEEPST